MMQGAQRKFYFNLVYLILDVNCIFTIGTLDFTLHLLANYYFILFPRVKVIFIIQ